MRALGRHAAARVGQGTQAASLSQKKGLWAAATWRAIATIRAVTRVRLTTFGEILARRSPRSAR